MAGPPLRQKQHVVLVKIPRQIPHLHFHFAILEENEAILAEAGQHCGAVISGRW